jgi:hypothetical protein
MSTEDSSKSVASLEDSVASGIASQNEQRKHRVQESWTAPPPDYGTIMRDQQNDQVSSTLHPELERTNPQIRRSPCRHTRMRTHTATRTRQRTQALACLECTLVAVVVLLMLLFVMYCIYQVSCEKWTMYDRHHKRHWWCKN